MDKNLQEKLQGLRTAISDPSRTEGERRNAKALYEKLLRKLGLKDEDIQPEQTEPFFVIYKNEFEKRLFRQIIANLRDSDNIQFWGIKRRRNIIGCDLTLKEKEQVSKLYEKLKPALRKGFERYFRAFIQSNDLGISKRKNTKELTEEEEEEILIIMRMSRTIDPIELIETRTDHLLGIK